MAENEWLSKDFYKVLGVSKDASVRLLSELTEHTLANEIEPPKEVLRKDL